MNDEISPIFSPSRPDWLASARKKLPNAGLGCVSAVAPLMTGFVGSGLSLPNNPLTAFLSVANPEDGRGLADRPLFGSVGTCRDEEALEAFLLRPRGGIMLIDSSSRARNMLCSVTGTEKRKDVGRLFVVGGVLSDKRLSRAYAPRL